MTISLNSIANLRVLTPDLISKLTPDLKDKLPSGTILPDVLNSDTSQCVVVQGYYKPGDGGGGTFLWDPTLKGKEDFGTIIKPSATDGGWRRLFDDSLSVKWFGAKGDMKEYYEDDKGKYHFQGRIDQDDNKFTLTLSDATGFTESDALQHKTIVIWLTTDKEAFITTIDRYDNEKNVYLADPAPKNMTGAFVAWGTDDTDAIQHAIDVAKQTGYIVYLPPGHFIITSTLSYITYQDMTYVDKLKPPQQPLRDEYRSPYSLQMHGLQMVGAGKQVSFIHNLIKKGGAAIKIDGAYDLKEEKEEEKEKVFTFQQTGLLKDFNITSTGNVPQTIGIDMRATWSYTIQNVSVMKMGSDGIVFHNNHWIAAAGSSDGDACNALHLDNVFAYKNGGWGIKVDSGIHGLSTGKINIERCWMEDNKLGGIQWAGQLGAIERCGIYGNGVSPKGTVDPDKPTYIPGAHGILVKNVKGNPNCLLISRCEIQDNADVQVMVESGSNIKIVQNEFKADNLDIRYTFPSTDIQVGDGNLGDTDITASNYRGRSNYPQTLNDLPSGSENMFDLDKAGFEKDVIFLNQVGILTKTTAFHFPTGKEAQWLLINNTKHSIKYGKKGDLVKMMPSVLPSSWGLITAYQKPDKKWDIRNFGSRPVNNCVIEDNLVRVLRNDTSIGAPFRGAYNVNNRKHTAVKVNTNAIGTIIRGWFLNAWDSNKDTLVELVENDPIFGKRVLIEPIQYFGKTHINTSLHRDGTDGGHVLLPFASRQEPIRGQREEYIPDTSRWCSYRFHLTENAMLLVMKNPTTRTIGTPLFLEFASAVRREVMVEFGNKDEFEDKIDNEYNITSLLIPPATTVTGILLFGMGNKWTLFSPWTCEGRPLMKPYNES